MRGPLLASCLAIVVASLLGGMLPLRTVLSHTRLQLYLSFAAGSMLGAAFLHMLPEAAEAGPSTAMNWAAAGLFTVFFLERFLAFHHHEAPADPSDPCPEAPHAHLHGHGHAAGLVHEEVPGGGQPVKSARLVWGVAAVGLAIHNFIGGIALASALGVRPEGAGGVGLGVFLATLIHKPADSLTIVSLMLRAGMPRATAHLVNLGFALIFPLGVATFVLGLSQLDPEASGNLTACVLAFSAGTFLCIALSDLLPELQFHEHDRLALSASLMAGFGLMVLALIGE